MLLVNEETVSLFGYTERLQMLSGIQTMVWYGTFSGYPRLDIYRYYFHKHGFSTVGEIESDTDPILKDVFLPTGEINDRVSIVISREDIVERQSIAGFVVESLDFGTARYHVQLSYSHPREWPDWSYAGAWESKVNLHDLDISEDEYLSTMIATVSIDADGVVNGDIEYDSLFTPGEDPELAELNLDLSGQVSGPVLEGYPVYEVSMEVTSIDATKPYSGALWMLDQETARLMIKSSNNDDSLVFDLTLAP